MNIEKFGAIHVSPEITIAIIAAVVTVFGSIVTLVIGFWNLKTEREKLEADRERLRKELRESARQAQVWQAEISKLQAESNKISGEAFQANPRYMSFIVIREELDNLPDIGKVWTEAATGKGFDYLVSEITNRQVIINRLYKKCEAILDDDLKVNYETLNQKDLEISLEIASLLNSSPFENSKVRTLLESAMSVRTDIDGEFRKAINSQISRLVK